jgi:zinc finger BED domain-containing protein 4
VQSHHLAWEDSYNIFHQTVNHLSSLHPVEYKAFTQQTDARACAVQHQLSAHTASGPKQLTVDESFGQMKPWPSDHKTAVLGTHRIAEMIAVDLQPFSIVEDIGFRRGIVEIDCYQKSLNS